MDNVIIKKSKINGKGAFATKDYKKGDIVLKWHPIKLTEDKFRNLSKQEIKYTFKEKDSIFLMQEPEKYVNYSCSPNTKVSNYSDIATKNIKSGEEITSNYGGLSNPDFICNCQSKNCIKLFKKL